LYNLKAISFKMDCWKWNVT